MFEDTSVHSAGINSFSFHPSNNFLISGSSDSTIKILDLLEGRLIYTLHVHKGAVFTVAFSRAGELFASGGADGQVLLWRTNFDTKSYQDILQQHSRRSTPDPPPHVSDIHPRGPHLHHPQPADIQITPTVADTQSADPPVIELSQAVQSTKLSSSRARLTSPLASANSHHTGGLPSCCMSRSKLEGWMGDKSGNTGGASAGSQTQAEVKRKERREEEERGQTHPSDVLSSRPSSLDSTLLNIVKQLDILTQTVSVLEARLTLTEDKVKECLLHQSHILKNVRSSEGRRNEGPDDPPARFT